MASPKSSYHRYSIAQTLPIAPAKAFTYFADEKKFQRLTPPWLGFKVLKKSTPRLRAGTQLDYLMLFRGVPMHWQSRITEWEPPHRFSYVQLKGPYSFFKHEHFFAGAAGKPGQTRMTDRVTFELPGMIRHPFVEHLVKADIRRVFEYRRDTIEFLKF
jgi:ligand-binding SRPBCC domain-containing protein